MVASQRCPSRWLHYSVRQFQSCAVWLLPSCPHSTASQSQRRVGQRHPLQLATASWTERRGSQPAGLLLHLQNQSVRLLGLAVSLSCCCYIPDAVEALRGTWLLSEVGCVLYLEESTRSLSADCSIELDLDGRTCLELAAASDLASTSR